MLTANIVNQQNQSLPHYYMALGLLSEIVSFLCWYCKTVRLNWPGEKCCTYPELRDEKLRRLEFSCSSLSILNSLEHMGYKVVTSGSFVASQVKKSL